MPQAKSDQLDTQSRPSLNSTDLITGALVQMGFGYMGGEPVVGIFKGDEPDPVLVLSKEVLAIAVEQGWADHGNDCPHCHPD